MERLTIDDVIEHCKRKTAKYPGDMERKSKNKRIF